MKRLVMMGGCKFSQLGVLESMVENDTYNSGKEYIEHWGGLHGDRNSRNRVKSGYVLQLCEARAQEQGSR